MTPVLEKVESKNLTPMLVLALCVLASHACWAMHADTRKQLRSRGSEELAASRRAILAEREATIRELVAIVSDKALREKNIPAVVNAVELLGELRAIEAAPVLLRILRFHRKRGLAERTVPVIKIYVRTVDPDALSRERPCVRALIKMRVPPDSVVEYVGRLKHVQDLYCCVGVLIGTEGEELARVVLERAIREAGGAPDEKERLVVPGRPPEMVPVEKAPEVYGKKYRLKSALRMLKKFTERKRRRKR